MAASPLSPLLIILLALGPFLLGLHLHADAAGAAPAPKPQPLSLTAILGKGGQFSTLMRLLNETQIGQQIQSQLKDSYGGLTVFAPTDNAFNNLKTGTLNGLSAQQQVNLVLFHVLPRFYSFDMFQTASNPVRTQASDSEGPYTLNITSTNNQANVSTGVDETRINTALYENFPIAVYPVDAVLLPYNLFGAKPPASAPSPASTATTGPKAPSTPAAKGPAAEATTSPSSAASFVGRTAGRGIVMGVAGLVGACLLW